MVMDLQEISDRMEIQNLLIDYCSAVDEKNFAIFDSIFTQDAFIDYSAVGGAKGTLEEIKTYLSKALVIFPRTQHMIGNIRIWLEGDKARARTICHNPMVWQREDSSHHEMFYGIWYVDELVRTEQGWRISKRSEEFCYHYNVPEEFRAIP